MTVNRHSESNEIPWQKEALNSILADKETSCEPTDNQWQDKDFVMKSLLEKFSRIVANKNELLVIPENYDRLAYLMDEYDETINELHKIGYDTEKLQKNCQQNSLHLENL